MWGFAKADRFLYGCTPSPREPEAMETPSPLEPGRRGTTLLDSGWLCVGADGKPAHNPDPGAYQLPSSIASRHPIVEEPPSWRFGTCTRETNRKIFLSPKHAQDAKGAPARRLELSA